MSAAVRLHASAVAAEGRGAVILGASGSGKSALALQLLALGARLVSDDQVVLEPRDGVAIVSAPEPIRGMIEARFVGLLNAGQLAPEAELALAVTLDEAEVDRLPPHRTTTLAGVEVPLLRRVDAPHFPAAILAYLRHGRQA